MSAISQEQAVDRSSLSRRDHVCFWRDPRWDDLECLHARFLNHVYCPHIHETFAMGVILDGIERYTLKGVHYAAGAGDMGLVNPGELHDGCPGEDGYQYRMFYPTEALMARIATEVTGRPVDRVYFRQGLVKDPDVYALLTRAHLSMEYAETNLKRDSDFLEAAALLIERHADTNLPPIQVGREVRAIATVCDYAEDRLEEELDLDELAGLVGFSRFQLIRVFRRELGITPHAWIMNRRVARAKQLMAAGTPPAQTAAACGFYDQAHLTRNFKAVTGVTPAKYRTAFLR